MKSNRHILGALGAFLAHVGLRQLDDELLVVRREGEAVLRVPQEGGDVVGTTTGSVGAAPARARRPTAVHRSARPASAEGEQRRVEQVTH